MLNYEVLCNKTMQLLTQLFTKSNTFEITIEFLVKIFMGTLLPCVLVTYKKLYFLEMICVLFNF
jgi:hypothetical protein